MGKKKKKPPKSKKFLAFELFTLILFIIVLFLALTKLPELWGLEPFIEFPWELDI